MVMPAMAVFGAVEEFLRFTVSVSPGFKRSVGDGVPST
jgi:hypothetical protein